jgi:hypothetical protein
MLQLLKALFGKGYLNKIIGTRTNVAKPIKMDKDSPFKKYSDDAFNDPKALEYIEKKINEYGPYALSNKNPQEIANFEANAKRLLEAKNKQTGTTPGMAQQIAESMFGPIGKKAKPEAEIIDITTQQKIEPEGIMKLKEKLGSPEKSSPIDNLKEDIAKLTEREARAYSANIESYRRPIIREMLLKDTKIKLPDDVRKSLENKDDLQRGANPEMDPLRLLNKYYEMDFNKLDELEEIRFTARNETEAADEFLKKGGLEPKKDLGDKLKDYDGDPDGLAEGGRIGFAAGGIKALIAMMNKKFGKDTMKTADEVKPSEFKAFKTERDFDDLADKLKLEEEFKAFKERNPDFKLPYADKDKRIIPEGLTEEDVDFAILKGEFERKYSKLIPEDLMRTIMADDDMQRVKDIIGHVEQAAIMTDKGMSPDQIVDAFKKGEKRKDNADGGLNYLMGL